MNTALQTHMAQFAPLGQCSTRSGAFAHSACRIQSARPRAAWRSRGSHKLCPQSVLSDREGSTETVTEPAPAQQAVTNGQESGTQVHYGRTQNGGGGFRQQQRRSLNGDQSVYFRVDFKRHYQAGVQAIKMGDDVVDILSHYIETMEQHFQRNENRLDQSHVGAILYGLARVWIAAQNVRPQDANKLQNARYEAEAFLQRMVPRIQHVMPRLSARNVSSILWAFSKLGFNADKIVPGTTDSLGQQFILDIHSCSDHSYASLLGACMDLDINPCNGKLVPAVVRQLAYTDVSKFQSYSLSVIMFSLAKLGQGNAQTIDALCDAFLQRLQSPIDAQVPNSIGVANFAWSLQKLKHMPSAELGAAMVSRICSLIARQPQSVHTPHVSKILLACAELRLDLSPVDTSLLLTQLLRDTRLNEQVIANAAWSLAILGSLKMDTLQQLFTRFIQLPGTHHESHARQIYQALDSLKSTAAVDPVQQVAWTQMEADMQSALGERQPPTTMVGRTEADNLYAALDGLGLNYESHKLVRGYMTYAIVQPVASADPASAPPIILQLGQPDHFRNDFTRLTGRASFFIDQLSQEGTLVFVPSEQVRERMETLALYLTPELEEAAGGSLNAYRQ